MAKRKFDDARYGEQLARRPSSVVDVYQAWLEAHPNGDIEGFSNWVRNTTGSYLMDLVDEEDLRRLKPLIADDEEAADSIIEGLDAGP